MITSENKDNNQYTIQQIVNWLIVNKKILSKKLIFFVILKASPKPKLSFHVRHSYLWITDIKPVLDVKSISKSAPITHDNSYFLLILFIFAYRKLVCQTTHYQSTLGQIMKYIFILKLILQHIFVDSGALHGMRALV